LRPEASVIKVEGLVGYQVALTREAARRQSDARLEEMMRKKACGKPPTIVFPCISQIETWPLVFCRRIRSRQRRFQSRASSALDSRDGEWPFHVAVCCAQHSAIRNVRFTSTPAVPFAQIAVMSGRRPVVKGGFEAVMNVSGAVMSTAC
jgi:hypothetical protein